MLCIFAVVELSILDDECKISANVFDPFLRSGTMS